MVNTKSILMIVFLIFAIDVAVNHPVIWNGYVTTNAIYIPNSDINSRTAVEDSLLLDMKDGTMMTLTNIKNYKDTDIFGIWNPEEQVIQYRTSNWLAFMIVQELKVVPIALVLIAMAYCISREERK